MEGDYNPARPLHRPAAAASQARLLIRLPLLGCVIKGIIFIPVESEHRLAQPNVSS